MAAQGSGPRPQYGGAARTMTQLDPDAWDRLACVFAHIVELPVHERARAIATRTVGEPPLAAEIPEMGGWLLYTSPRPRDRTRYRMPASA